jgi:tetratricopeptide (TPR) repeat protein
MNRLLGFIVITSLAVSGCANQKAPEQLSSQAETNVAAGKYKKALSLYNEAIQTSTKDSALFAKRAAVETLLLDYEAALSDYNRAIELRNDVAWYHSKRARVLGELNQPGEAIVSANRALELEPGDVQTLAYRANAYAQQGSYDRGLADAIQAKHGGDLVYTYRVLGTCYVHLGKPDEAIDCLQKAINLNPKDQSLFCLKSEAEMLKLDLKQAVFTASRAREMNPKAMEPYSCLARAYLLSGDYTQARENIDRVLQQSPIDGRALLTVYHMSTNELDRALESALAVVKERPSAASQETLSEVYTLMGRGEEALEICEGLVTEYPKSSEAHRAKALALLGLGRNQEAKLAASKSIDLLAYNPVAFRLRSEACSRLGDKAAAQADRTMSERLGYSINLPQERIMNSLQKQLAKQHGTAKEI